ncbi:MAG: hypothetical protein A2017_00715 [Lentisphaerae bacterium GWF2_44_16]|nr:MAG: hypothetical protein A2017_00715 [Lentisphaerae bacterium GWF2_44_16]
MVLKYIEVKDYLINLINAGKDQDALPSENDLCSYMKASRVTVRRALDELEHEGLIRRQKGKGAFICKIKKVKKALNIFLGISKDESFILISNIMAGILDQIKGDESGLHIFITDENMNETLQNIQKHEIDGIIGIRPYPVDYPIYEELRQRGYPVLLIDRAMKNSHYSYVSSDFTQASFLATDYLLGRGHKKIMFVGTAPWIPISSCSKTGFEKALQKHKISKADSLIINVDEFESKASFFDDVSRIFEHEFTRLKPTAVVCISELFFVNSVYPVLHKKKLAVPEDVEIALCSATFESTPLRNSIHEIRKPEYELGKHSVESLKKMINGKTNRVNIVLPVELLRKDFKS